MNVRMDRFVRSWMGGMFSLAAGLVLSSGNAALADDKTWTFPEFDGTGTLSSSNEWLFNLTNTGTLGGAGRFEISSTSNLGVVVKGYTKGKGIAGWFEIDNSENTTCALYGRTEGSGPAVQGYTEGTGKAGHFSIYNSQSPATALYANTTGTGNALHSYQQGTGKAGYFQIDNPANNSFALYAKTSGLSTAGFFETTNVANDEPALKVVSNATGENALEAHHTANGRAGYFFNNYNSYYTIKVENGGASPLAGWFIGDVNVDGSLSKDAGSFKIDHPLDPANMYLYHSFVESPDMKNIYDGVVELDENGEAEVTLPDWFEALNRDFRYQLTCIGGFAPVFVAEEVADNAFIIAGGEPGMKVSWQVTGIRQDAYAEAHRIPVEAEKAPAERGRYRHPELYGQPAHLRMTDDTAEPVSIDER